MSDEVEPVVITSMNWLDFEPYTKIRVIGNIGFTVCKRCGATLMLDANVAVDVYGTHEDFHKRIDPR